MSPETARWRSALAEARHQLLTRKQEGADNSWWDVAEGAPASLPPGVLPPAVAAAAAAASSASTTPPLTSSSPWRQEEWHIAFAILFYEAPPGAWAGGDDLLFFVLADAWAGSGPAGWGGGRADAGGGRPASRPQRRPPKNPSPLLVRRRGPAPPPGLGLGGADSRTIDWAASTALNLAAQQGGYRLGLVAARAACLPGLAIPTALAASAGAALGGCPAPAASSPAVAAAGACVVEHAVHATPMRVAVEEVFGGGGGGGGGRTVGGGGPAAAAAAAPVPSNREPEVSYPDVCFEVGGGEGGSGGGARDGGGGATPHTQHHLILSAPGDAFAVFLISAGGGGGTDGLEGEEPGATPSPPSHTDLFAGFVTYEQLVGALTGPGRQSGRSGAATTTTIPSLFGRRPAGATPPPPPEHVRMRGPGGAGCADVAVTVLGPAGCEAAAHPPPPPAGLASFLARAAAAALGTAAARSPPPPPVPAGPPRFACSLFRLSLPINELTARLCSSSPQNKK
jgi:hypothetical protein